MRYFLLIPACLLFITQCSGQAAVKAPYHFQSYAYGLTVTKKEQLVVTTRVGEVAIAGSPTGLWRKADPVAKDNTSLLMGQTFDQPNFFNNDTGFVSGFVNSGGGKYDIIYHTIDGGNNWKAIKFGEGGWVDDAVNLDNGEAWMSVSGSGIEYTSDFGFHWKRFAFPEPKQRFTNIYFNTKRQGLAGSLWNMLAYTDDNCDNWKILPTPLDQKKYTKTDADDRPEFDRVAIFGDYFLVNQENQVFYSKRDVIDWIRLKGYTDIYTDEVNSALFCKTSKGNFVKMNDQMGVQFEFAVTGATFDAACRNGNLFVMCGEKIMKLQGDNSIAYFPIYTDQPAVIEPRQIGYTLLGEYGAIGNRIYSRKTYNEEWNYLYTLPFETGSGSLSMMGDGRILYDFPDSLYYYNTVHKTIERQSKEKMLADFCEAGTRKITFEKGSQGCFHHFADELAYSVNEQGGFELEKKVKDKPGKKDFTLPGNNRRIEKSIVDDFVKQLPAIVNKLASIDELGFTESDYEQCRQDILKFKSELGKKKKGYREPEGFVFKRNNLDFDKLLALVDTIRTLDMGRLNNILFRLSDDYSTTTNWTMITLVNNKGELLVITNYYYEPNSFHFPWRMSLNGVNYYNTSIEINRFVDEAYPGFLNEKDTKKVEVLYTLVKALYED